jgi:hypothetical protein
MYTTAYYDSSVTGYTYNGQTYQYLVTSIGSVLVRQDGNKVYLVDNADSLERLVYDFDLELYDTAYVNYPQDKYTAWVTSIDSTQLMGQWYKVWHFEGIDSVLFYPDSARPISYNVIEGIGCTNGPYYPANAYNRAAFSQQLLCFNNDMNITSGLSNAVIAYGYDYQSYYDNDSSCIEFYADHSTGPIIISEGVAEIAQAAGNAIIAPNPTDNTSKIVFPYKVADGRLTILNQVGQVIHSVPFSNKNEIGIGELIQTTGMYYYRVTDEQSGKVFSGKFIRQ